MPDLSLQIFTTSPLYMFMPIAPKGKGLDAGRLLQAFVDAKKNVMAFNIWLTPFESIYVFENRNR